MPWFGDLIAIFRCVSYLQWIYLILHRVTTDMINKFKVAPIKLALLSWVFHALFYFILFYFLCPFWGQCTSSCLTSMAFVHAGNQDVHTAGVGSFQLCVRASYQSAFDQQSNFYPGRVMKGTCLAGRGSAGLGFINVYIGKVE